LGKTSRSVLGAALVFALLGFSASPDLLAAPPTGAGDPPPSAARSGEAAVDALGERLPSVARAYGLTAARLKEHLRADANLRLDGRDKLLYVEPGLAEFTAAADAEPLAPPQAAAAAAPLEDTFLLHSLPGSRRTIYLDFDGHVLAGTPWNADYLGNLPLVCPAWNIDGNPTAFGTTERTVIQQVWQRVAEDYAPFDVDVTTEYPGEDALALSTFTDQDYGVRVLISPVSSSIAPGAGGIAYVGSFDWVTEPGVPALVFPENLGNGEKYIAEASTHEAGHTLGLFHDGVTGVTSYYRGHGAGETGWAPIMGTGYYRNLTQWSKGEYLNPTNTEDDLAIIPTHGLAFRPDDVGDDLLGATALPLEPSPQVTRLIGRTGDSDVFSLRTGTGTLSVSAAPETLGANLDILLELRDAAGALVASSNPTDFLAASLSQAVTTGTYYLTVRGTGKGTLPATGYSDYGSLGTYTLSASVAPFVITPTAGAHGSITPSTPQVVEAGADLTFAITPDTGYHVQDVLVDGISVGGVTSFGFVGVDADRTIEAVFAENAPGQPFVTAPNTGGTFPRQSTIPVTWTVPAPVDSGAFVVYLKTSTGGSFLLTTQNAVAAQTEYTYDWTFTQPVGTGYRILVWYRNAAGSYLYYDFSDVPFDIFAPQPTVTAPNTGGTFPRQSTIPVTWTVPAPVDSGTFVVYLKTSTGGNYLLTTQNAVAAQTEYTYDWTITQPVGTGYRILVWYRNAAGSYLYYDFSDVRFDIN